MQSILTINGGWSSGMITTPCDITVLNQLDRCSLVMDTINQLPQTSGSGIS